MEEPLDLRELKALLVVGREGSITGAAKTLNIGQPDLTRILRRFEDKLGMKLLVRHARGVSLTTAGDEMVEHAETALGLMREIALEINASPDTLRNLMVPPSHRSFSPSRAAHVSAA